jgi:hypothetical protein
MGCNPILVERGPQGPAGPVGTVPYKIYSALLSQSGTNDPTAVVFSNTIGNIVWSRVGLGNFRGTLSGAFPQNKRQIFMGVLKNADAVDGAVQETDQGYSNDYLDFYGLNQLFQNADGFVNLAIEVRVYP